MFQVSSNSCPLDHASTRTSCVGCFSFRPVFQTTERTEFRLFPRTTLNFVMSNLWFPGKDWMPRWKVYGFIGRESSTLCRSAVTFGWREGFPLKSIAKNLYCLYFLVFPDLMKCYHVTIACTIFEFFWHDAVNNKLTK